MNVFCGLYTYLPTAPKLAVLRNQFQYIIGRNMEYRHRQSQKKVTREVLEGFYHGSTRRSTTAIHGDRFIRGSWQPGPLETRFVRVSDRYTWPGLAWPMSFQILKPSPARPATFKISKPGPVRPVECSVYHNLLSLGGATVLVDLHAQASDSDGAITYIGETRCST